VAEVTVDGIRAGVQTRGGQFVSELEDTIAHRLRGVGRAGMRATVPRMEGGITLGEPPVMQPMNERF
jgi:hypothetical protein